MNAPPILSDAAPPPLDSPPAELPVPNRRRWWIHLLLLGAYPLVLGLWGYGRLGSRGPALTHSAKGLVLVCAAELLVFGAVFGLAWLASRASRDDLLWRWRGGAWTVPLGIAYSIALRLAVGIILLIIGVVVVGVLLLTKTATPQALEHFVMNHVRGVGAVVDVRALRHDPVYFWLTVTLVSFVVAGLREELWRAGFLAGLRALGPRRFGSTAGQIAAVAVAAVVFGIGHVGMGLVAVGATALLGFGLGLIMVLHRSIWPAVIAHGMFDATSLALLPWVTEHLRQ